MSVPRTFVDFLASVDVQKDKEFILRAAGVFCAHEVTSEADMIGFTMSNVPVSQCLKADGSQSAGLHSFCARAVEKANANFRFVCRYIVLLLCLCIAFVRANMAQGVAAATPHTNGEAVTDLVRAVREEDFKVHIDLVRCHTILFRFDGKFARARASVFQKFL